MQELTTLLSSRSAASLGTSKATSQAVLDTQSECSRGSSLLPLDCDLELCPPAGGSRVLRGGETGEYLRAFFRWVLPTGVGLPVVTLWLARGRVPTHQDVSSRKHGSFRPGSVPVGQPPGNTGGLREGKPLQTACFALTGALLILVTTLGGWQCFLHGIRSSERLSELPRSSS